MWLNCVVIMAADLELCSLLPTEQPGGKPHGVCLA